MARRHRLESALAIGLAAMLLLSAPAAQAQSSRGTRLWQRFTFDWGYEVGAAIKDEYIDCYSLDATTGRQAAALVRVKSVVPAHQLSFGVAFSLKPWVGVGLDAAAYEEFSAPSHPWLDRFGIKLGRLQMLGAGVFAEFRPWQRSYAPRHGWFFGLGMRQGGLQRHTVRPENVEPLSGERGRFGFGWTGAGYRAVLSSAVSIHVLADAVYVLDYAYVGLRMGGGFH